MALRFLPWLPGTGREQTVLAVQDKGGEVRLELVVRGDDRLVARLDGDGSGAEAVCRPALAPRCWYQVAVVFDCTAQRLDLHLRSIGAGWGSAVETTSSTQADTGYRDTVAWTTLAGVRRPGAWTVPRADRHFNGKIENPAFWSRALGSDELGSDELVEAPGRAALIAAYDFGRDFTGTVLHDRSGNERHGTLHQAPQRGVTGSRWDGTAGDFRVCGQHYAAVHFHDDDLEDAGWPPARTWAVPDLAPGAYAFRLHSDDETDHIPFFVHSRSHAPALFLAPTFTYLAYANEHLYAAGGNQQFMAHRPELSRYERHVLDHADVGKSAYDLHGDGSGVAYSSRKRPVLNFRPYRHNWLAGNVRHFSADLFLLDWLDQIGIEHEVATDEDLHHDGQSLLDRHRVVVTGSHPEYWTRPMQEALHGYLSCGGRLMYLGGNGFYWVTSVFDDRPHLIEVRRGNNGARSWDSPPGETTHSATAQPGGLWAFNDYPPHAGLGVGMAAQGWGPASAYRRLPDSHDDRAAFVFDGIAPDEIIGGFGYVLGGAAGDEVDRYAPELGSPASTLRLATSTGLDDRYQLTQEELLITAPGQGGSSNEKVRSDMTLLETAAGGAVFSVGSICWAGSLAWNDYHNNVARISENVVRHFVR
ncbi:N,N-dimethylformamidase beta subunit family domain-containing protein [Pseudonocardia nantongensis]|uniref:N,N-dimethylformamidase beta subunit family domain-containing protein n=1 Tax=Pseudonocardia nantongensis TaxID=1181885 RepID=UPI00397AFC2C